MAVAADRLIVIAGPTATGKSGLALDLAEAMDGEVVNADSMQLYRGMDIGTAKLTPAERRGIPHHLLDVLEVTQTASVAAYQRDARTAIEDILARGRTPLLVGGSGLYLQAVTDEIDFPGTDPAVRARLTAELADRGVPAMRARLAAVDPEAAAVISAGDGRRIVRAIEVVELTGRPYSATLPRSGPARYDAVEFYLDKPESLLDEDLATRVDTMVERGFLDEVRALDRAGLRSGTTAPKALGYRQMLQVLDGDLGMPEAVRRTVAATRRFVRRQRSWFARNPRAIRLSTGDGTAALVDPIRRAASSGPAPRPSTEPSAGP
jgi:tRNA dimethylallyltransferase